MYPAPWRLPAGRPVGRKTLGQGLADFAALQSSDPLFAQAWANVNGQLTAEYGTLQAEGSQSVLLGQQRVTAAKLALESSYTQLATQFSGDPSVDIANVAQNYVMLGHTISGAVSTVQGLATAVSSGDVASVAQAFTGTMIGAVIALGAPISAGVGAAIVAGVGLTINLLQQLFSSKPPPGTNICGEIYPPTQPPQFLISNPGNPGGCPSVPCWTSFDNAQIAPGSVGWRPFPSRTDPADAGWYKLGPSNLLTWRGATWGVIQDPPLSQAFSSWLYLDAENSAAAAPDAFQRAFFAAWKANKAYAFNGLVPLKDYEVLLHVLRLHNTAYSPSSYRVLTQIDLDPGRPWQLYESSLVRDALGHVQPGDNLVSGQGLILHMGPLRNVPKAAIAPIAPPASTAKKIVVGAAATAAIGAVGIGAYAFLTRQSYAMAANTVWGHTKSWVGHAKDFAGHAWHSVAHGAHEAKEDAIILLSDHEAAAEETRKTMHVQSLLFSTSRGWTAASAKSWLSEHGYKYGRLQQTAHHLRFRQFPPHEGMKFRTVPFGRGISAVVAK